MLVKWVKLRASGVIEYSEEDVIELPLCGDGKFIGEIGYEVLAIAETPHLGCESHIILAEQ